MGDMCCLIKWIGTYGSLVMSAHIQAQSPCCAGTNLPREPPRKRIHMYIRALKRLQTRCIKPPHNKGTPYMRYSFSLSLSFSSLIVRAIFVQAEVQCCNIDRYCTVHVYSMLQQVAFYQLKNTDLISREII